MKLRQKKKEREEKKIKGGKRRKNKERKHSQLKSKNLNYCVFSIRLLAINRS
jgi:hypothetical protein